MFTGFPKESTFKTEKVSLSKILNEIESWRDPSLNFAWEKQAKLQLENKYDGADFEQVKKIKSFSKRTGRELRKGYWDKYADEYKEYWSVEQILLSSREYDQTLSQEEVKNIYAQTIRLIQDKYPKILPAIAEKLYFAGKRGVWPDQLANSRALIKDYVENCIAKEKTKGRQLFRKIVAGLVSTFAIAAAALSKIDILGSIIKASADENVQSVVEKVGLLYFEVEEGEKNCVGDANSIVNMSRYRRYGVEATPQWTPEKWSECVHDLPPNPDKISMLQIVRQSVDIYRANTGNTVTFNLMPDYIDKTKFENLVDKGSLDKALIDQLKNGNDPYSVIMFSTSYALDLGPGVEWGSQPQFEGVINLNFNPHTREMVLGAGKWQSSEATIMYYGQITEWVERTVEGRGGVKMTNQELLAHFLELNNGRMELALQEYANWKHFETRFGGYKVVQSSRTFDTNLAKLIVAWDAKYMVDQFSVGPSIESIYRLRPPDYAYNCDAAVCDKDADPFNQLKWHPPMIVALLSTMDANVLRLSQNGVNITSQLTKNEHGIEKTRVDLLLSTELPALQSYLNSLPQVNDDKDNMIVDTPENKRKENGVYFVNSVAELQELSKTLITKGIKLGSEKPIYKDDRAVIYAKVQNNKRSYYVIRNMRFQDGRNLLFYYEVSNNNLLINPDPTYWISNIPPDSYNINLIDMTIQSSLRVNEVSIDSAISKLDIVPRK